MPLLLLPTYTVLAPRLQFTKATQAAYTLYQKNMLFKMVSFRPLTDEILTQAPDFIALQEVSHQNQPILTSLAPQYPAQTG